MRAAEDAPRDWVYLHERRHGLAKIAERCAGVSAERRRVIHPHSEHYDIIIA